MCTACPGYDNPTNQRLVLSAVQHSARPANSGTSMSNRQGATAPPDWLKLAIGFLQNVELRLLDATIINVPGWCWHFIRMMVFLMAVYRARRYRSAAFQ